MQEKITINMHQIDSDAYVLKNKLMSRFDKVYGTNLTSADADDLSFFDIIMAPKTTDSLDLYAEIQTIAHHGVTDEQKNFLYVLFPFFSNKPDDEDFDAVIGHMEKMIEQTGQGRCVEGAFMVAATDNDAALASYYRQPLSILRMQRLGDEPMQAMLVQNGAILILEVVTSEGDLYVPEGL